MYDLPETGLNPKSACDKVILKMCIFLYFLSFFLNFIELYYMTVASYDSLSDRHSCL